MREVIQKVQGGARGTTRDLELAVQLPHGTTKTGQVHFNFGLHLSTRRGCRRLAIPASISIYYYYSLL